MSIDSGKVSSQKMEPAPKLKMLTKQRSTSKTVIASSNHPTKDVIMKESSEKEE